MIIRQKKAARTPRHICRVENIPILEVCVMAVADRWDGWMDIGQFVVLFTSATFLVDEVSEKALYNTLCDGERIFLFVLVFLVCCKYHRSCSLTI